MTLPDGVQTCTVTIGVPLDPFGNPARTFTGKIRTDRDLIWAATGEAIWRVEAPLPDPVDGKITFEIPLVDQAGVLGTDGAPITNWSYRTTTTATWTRDRRTSSKAFQVFADTVAPLNLDLIPDGTPMPPVNPGDPYVASIAGQSGAITTEALAEVLDGVTATQIGDPGSEVAAALEGGFVSKGQQIINVNDLPGVDPTGATSSTAALSALDENAAYLFPAGSTYLIRDATLKTGQQWHAIGATFIKDGGASDTNLLKATGTTTATSSALTANATPASGDTVTVASAAGFAVGDYVLLRDATYAYGALGRNQEINRIVGVAGTTITLANRILLSYTTAASAELVKLSPVVGSRVYGGTWINPLATSPTGGGFTGTLCVNVELLGSEFVGPNDEAGITWAQSYNCRDIDCSVRDGSNQATGGYGYGHLFRDSSHNCESIRLRTINVRENSFTDGARYCNYVDPVCLGHYDSGINTHGAGVKGCRIVRPVVGNCRGAGITVGFGTHNAGDSDIEILNPDIYNVGGHGIAVTGVATKENTRIRIVAPKVRNFGLTTANSVAVRVAISNDVEIIDPDVDGGTSTTATYGVFVTTATDVRVTRPKVRNIANGYGIGWATATRFKIDGADIAGVSSSNLRAVDALSTGVVIQGVRTDDTTLQLNGDETMRNNVFGTRIDTAGAIAKAGAPVDADYGAARDGLVTADTTNGRLYARVAGAWKYAGLRTRALTASTALDFPSVAAGGQQELTVTVTGAAAGDVVSLAPPAALEAGLSATGFVSATNTVKIRLVNGTGSAIDPASATWGVEVRSLA